MIIVTGAAGFIGSAMVSTLNNKGYRDVVAVDDFSKKNKERNLAGKGLTEMVEREEFIAWLGKNHRMVQMVLHLGARTDTAEFDRQVFEHLNTGYSRKVWEQCLEFGLPLIYASSAATYGDGSLGYKDDHDLVPRLKPLNPYGESKNEFDKWVLQQKRKPFFWAGFKFFNVYGPNEYHKGRMASVVFHAYRQIKEEGTVRLFRSHKPEYADGEQLRDFIYVKDVCDLMLYFMEHRPGNGIYNAGTGKARGFNDLAGSVFKALNIPEKIEYIDTPEDIRDKYQYFTEAPMEKVRAAGYNSSFASLEEGVRDYVLNYLEKSQCF